MISREKLLEAAARVYAEAGFRGSTTRRIAEEAGVNEITIFRLFGSKSALLAEAVRHFAPALSGHDLPLEPVHPERELTDWIVTRLQFFRSHASLIRKSLAEFEERPDLGAQTCEGCVRGQVELKKYANRVAARFGKGRAADLDAAVSMLIGAILGDAMAGDVMPGGVVARPVEEAAGAFARVFLRALEVPTSSRVARNGRAAQRRPVTRS